ncbi:Phosphoribosylglycinamide formyltransferase 2 [Actinobacillus pleuropneumoniae serovar 13 str. N273]|nr:Phosphoribosylglycinamide formyltransferase 2 [Actinobacillus pleuropneumoniae serovar 13 str. N273]
MASQELSQFALHARAILGLPIPEIYQISPAASKAIVVEGKSNNMTFGNLDKVLEEIGTNIRQRRSKRSPSFRSYLSS